MALEAGSGLIPDAAARVYDKSFELLGPLLGVSGVRALMLRSAKLSAGSFACLLDPQHLETSARLRACLDGQPAAVALDTAASLFGTFFELLALFIGQRLTTQIIRGTWQGLDQAEPAPEEKTT